MLGKNSNGKKSMPHDNVLNTIARGTEVEGTIKSKGDIRVEGKVSGEIYCESKLVIGEHGSVEGFVDARNAYIAGEVKGQVVVRELLQLQEKGRIEGDIYTSKLSVQVGATFTGNCRMGQEAETMMGEARARADKNRQQQPKRVTLNNGNGKAVNGKSPEAEKNLAVHEQ